MVLQYKQELTHAEIFTLYISFDGVEIFLWRPMFVRGCQLYLLFMYCLMPFFKWTYLLLFPETLEGDELGKEWRVTLIDTPSCCIRKLHHDFRILQRLGSKVLGIIYLEEMIFATLGTFGWFWLLYDDGSLANVQTVHGFLHSYATQQSQLETRGWSSAIMQNRSFNQICLAN